jgi:CRP/FNR family cyclic AMP-dependent transcriptional regulator
VVGLPADVIDAAFSRRGWLSLQDADFRQTIIRHSRLLTFRADAPIFHSGDEAGGIYGIVSGSIGCEVTTPVTSPTLVHVMQAGWWFGEGPMIFGRQRNMSFMALEDATLLLVPLQALRAIASADAHAAGVLGQIAEITAVLAIEAGCELLIRDARQRIAAVLLRVTAVLDGVTPGNPRGFRITQSQLAEMSNVSRHHTNVALLELQAGGYVALDYGRIDVRAPHRLAEFVGGASAF